MSASRRKFFETSGIFLSALLIGSHKLLAAADPEIYLALQLSSLRDDMRKDPSGTLKEVADIGYKYVELENYKDGKFYGYRPFEFRKLLEGYGLLAPSGHVMMVMSEYNFKKNDFTDKWKYTIEDAATVGQKFLVSPWMEDNLRQNINDFKTYMEVLNKSGELCKRSGLKFGYHNHDFEFTTKIDGQLLYSLLLDNTDPLLVAQELDIGNLYKAGFKAIDIAKKYPDRFELIHIKDEIRIKNGNEKYESTILGQGNVGIKEVSDFARNMQDTKYLIIEQESFQGLTPLECSKKNYAIMKGWGF